MNYVKMNHTKKEIQGELFVNWHGHEVTEKQRDLLEERTKWLWDWDLPVPDGVEEGYEKSTGKSCVYWGELGCSIPDKESLPRTEEYVTNGYTEGFVKYVCDLAVEKFCK